MENVPRFHVVSTGKQSIEELIHTIAAIHHFADAVHLREKTKTAAELVQIMEGIERCGVSLSKIIVNDRADVAQAMGAKGVHLAYHSLSPDRVKKSFPDLLVGKSVHSAEEAHIAEKQGADYVFYGHVFSSRSKEGQLPRGLVSLKKVKEAVSIPVVGIGGITRDNMLEVVQTGVYGAAVMSGVFMANNPAGEARCYQGILQTSFFRRF
jgi:thiazole tautomerase (transcriptional regulator TenI)